MWQVAWDFADELRRFGPTSGGVYPRRESFARAYCTYVTTSHYENFSVASLLLPRPLLPHFNAVYAKLGVETRTAAAGMAMNRIRQLHPQFEG